MGGKQLQESHFLEKLRAHAEAQFGLDNSAAIQQWLEYWSSTGERNGSIVSFFRSRMNLCLSGKRVLDIGCGAAGLSQSVTQEGGIYFGSDFYEKTLDFGKAFIEGLSEWAHASLVRASAIQLPFKSSCFDCVIAFDVIEHLVGGNPWQVRFLKEIERVLAPDGILLLTTPNWLCPLEGHTFLLGPQFLPTRLADHYIRRFRPQFYREYKTYAEVHLLSPWRMKSILVEAGLKPLHELPWCTDLSFYRPLARMFLRLCCIVKLDWAVFYKFQIVAAKKASVSKLESLKYPLRQQKFFQEQGLNQLFRKVLQLLDR